MKLKALTMAALGVALATSTTALAAHNYGMAGCGVGSLVFKDQPGKIQILAATTNEAFVQTFSISSGTSNCLEDEGGNDVASYIDANKPALENDISRGSGETVTGLLVMLDCGRQQERAALVLKSNYQSLFPAKATGQQIESNIRKALGSDSAICGA